MRQKVVVALGILKGADLFVLDEPNAGLDLASSKELFQVIGDLAQEGKAVLLSSHDAIAFSQVASRIGVLHEGRLVREESAAAYRQRDIENLSQVPLE